MRTHRRASQRQEIFTGMLVYDSMTVFFRMFLLAFAFWFIILVRMTGLADRQDGQDFYTLLLGATLGMCLMASANHLMTVFLAVEMASVPSYVMAGIIKGRRRASEAALKYAVYGAGAAGVMLYGISLLAGLLGTAHLPTIAAKLAAMDIPGMIASGEGGGTLMVLVLAGADDHGRPGVQALGRAVPLLVPGRVRRRVGRSRCVPVGRVEGGRDGAAGPRRARRQHRRRRRQRRRHRAHRTVPAHTVAFQQAARRARPPQRTPPPPPTAATPPRSPRSARSSSGCSPIIAAVTCTFGNLAAYGQTNIKRLLAYSTIAHAGYMIMAVAAAVQLAGTNAGRRPRSRRRAAVLSGRCTCS